MTTREREKKEVLEQESIHTSQQKPATTTNSELPSPTITMQ
jgi:hypothetical protein